MEQPGGGRSERNRRTSTGLSPSFPGGRNTRRASRFFSTGERPSDRRETTRRSWLRLALPRLSGREGHKRDEISERDRYPPETVSQVNRVAALSKTEEDIQALPSRISGRPRNFRINDLSVSVRSVADTCESFGKWLRSKTESELRTGSSLCCRNIRIVRQAVWRTKITVRLSQNISEPAGEVQAVRTAGNVKVPHFGVLRFFLQEGRAPESSNFGRDWDGNVFRYN